MNYPKIYLVLDNCFAIKRWVEPETWGPLIKQLGFDYVEASFDNEADFFYSPDWYLDEWFERVKAVEAAQDIRIANFFTGYQTYRTAGLAHPNRKMARHMLEGWVKPAIERLGARGSGIGFSLHAYPDRVLQDPELYKKETRKVSELLSEIGGIAKDNGNIPVCVEAMYAPHQTPWTIEGTKNFLRDIYRIDHHPIYTTVDLGHMVGQVRFRKPGRDEIRQSIEAAVKGGAFTEPWLGGDTTYAIWEKAVQNKDTSDAALNAIEADMARYPHLFSFDPADSDPYAWLEALACYSPIMHMQQTNGVTSSHAAFTKDNNAAGIIDGARLLRAIAKSYETEDPAMPPKAEAIYLSFEIFASNAEHPREIKNKLKETCAYWRTFIPKDGMPLNELIELLK
ncbi:TIM barrel protein [Eubacterium maltosivorans]|uniref:TIM barrel protein n=1 Tax=Eubacterium maltosivorans TaxID=2041044 RepID=UPI003A94DF43